MMGMMTEARREQLRAALGNPPTDETSGDMSGLTARMPTRYVDIKDHTRIVKGAEDLVHPMAGRSGGGVGHSTTPIPDMSRHAIKDDEDITLAPRDLRTERQRELMYSLVDQLRDLNEDIGDQASDYTAGMTERGLWTPGKGGNASRWIGNMIRKVRELRDVAKAEVTARTDEHNTPPNTFPEVPDGRYAVQDSGPGDWMFVKVDTGRKGGMYEGRRFVKVQASDELHPIRNHARRDAILTTIMTYGVVESMQAYGQHIGRCGRCNRTLTDATSRAYGIGPECRSKL